MIDVATRRFLVKDPIALGDVADLSLCAAEKSPAGGVRLVCLSVALENFRRVALRVHGDRDEINFLAEIGAEAILDVGHFRRQQRTGVRAACKDESDSENLAAEFLESEPHAVLLRERELRRGFDLRQIFSVGEAHCRCKPTSNYYDEQNRDALIRDPQQSIPNPKAAPQTKIENPKSPHAFSSFFSSLRNRQSVPLAIIRCGSTSSSRLRGGVVNRNALYPQDRSRATCHTEAPSLFIARPPSSTLFPYPSLIRRRFRL